MKFSRRSVLRATAASICRARVGRAWRADRLSESKLQRQARVWKHGLSLFGDLKYPEGFKHFDYVNPARAAGRHRAPDRLRHLRQFQYLWWPA